MPETQRPNITFEPILKHRTACMLATALLAGPLAAGQDDAAREFLLQAVADPSRAAPVLLALRATGDKGLVPVFAALSRSGDKTRRLLAIEALGDLAGAAAREVLLERLWKDDQAALRAEALARLIGLDAVSEAELRKAMAMDNEGVRCVAACELVRRKQGGLATATLETLTASKDLTTASLARMSLLGLGQTQQLPILSRTLRGRRTPERVTELLMAQIREEKVTAALTLAEHVAANGETTWLRVQAHMAAAALRADGAAALREAIRTSGNIVLRVQLLQVLAERSDSAKQLESLAAGSGTVAVLARFELARAGGGVQAGQAAAKVIALGHPIVVDYVLSRAGDDVKKLGAKADFYARALLGFIRSLDADAATMGAEHVDASQAAAILCDLATPSAQAGLRKLLAGRFGPTKLAVVRGLLHARTPRSVKLAVPLLKDPYSRIAREAALALGRFSDPAATGALREIARHPRRHPLDVTAQACWYLLKIAKRARPAAGALAKALE